MRRLRGADGIALSDVLAITEMARKLQFWLRR
jgi:hypothetical protein